jgi:hypothetical protein
VRKGAESTKEKNPSSVDGSCKVVSKKGCVSGKKREARRNPLRHLCCSLMNDSSGVAARIMTMLSKTLLAVSATGFTAGSIIDFGGFSLNPSWTVALPLGAVCFGLFLISLMLEKEMAGFDAEQARKWELIKCNVVAPAPKRKPDAQPIITQFREKTS